MDLSAQLEVHMPELFFACTADETVCFNCTDDTLCSSSNDLTETVAVDAYTKSGKTFSGSVSDEGKPVISSSSYTSARRATSSRDHYRSSTPTGSLEQDSVLMPPPPALPADRILQCSTGSLLSKKQTRSRTKRSLKTNRDECRSSVSGSLSDKINSGRSAISLRRSIVAGNVSSDDSSVDEYDRPVSCDRRPSRPDSVLHSTVIENRKSTAFFRDDISMIFSPDCSSNFDESAFSMDGLRRQVQRSLDSSLTADLALCCGEVHLGSVDIDSMLNSYSLSDGASSSSSESNNLSYSVLKRVKEFLDSTDLTIDQLMTLTDELGSRCSLTRRGTRRLSVPVNQSELKKMGFDGEEAFKAELYRYMCSVSVNFDEECSISESPCDSDTLIDSVESLCQDYNSKMRCSLGAEKFSGSILQDKLSNQELGRSPDTTACAPAENIIQLDHDLDVPSTQETGVTSTVCGTDTSTVFDATLSKSNISIGKKLASSSVQQDSSAANSLVLSALNLSDNDPERLCARHLDSHCFSRLYTPVRSASILPNKAPMSMGTSACPSRPEMVSGDATCETEFDEALNSSNRWRSARSKAPSFTVSKLSRSWRNRSYKTVFSDDSSLQTEHSIDSANSLSQNMDTDAVEPFNSTVHKSSIDSSSSSSPRTPEDCIADLPDIGGNPASRRSSPGKLDPEEHAPSYEVCRTISPHSALDNNRTNSADLRDCHRDIVDIPDNASSKDTCDVLHSTGTAPTAAENIHSSLLHDSTASSNEISPESSENAALNGEDVGRECLSCVMRDDSLTTGSQWTRVFQMSARPPADSSSFLDASLMDRVPVASSTVADNSHGLAESSHHNISDQFPPAERDYQMPNATADSSPQNSSARESNLVSLDQTHDLCEQTLSSSKPRVDVSSVVVNHDCADDSIPANSSIDISQLLASTTNITAASHLPEQLLSSEDEAPVNRPLANTAQRRRRRKLFGYTASTVRTWFKHSAAPLKCPSYTLAECILAMDSLSDFLYSSVSRLSNSDSLDSLDLLDMTSKLGLAKSPEQLWQLIRTQLPAEDQSELVAELRLSPEQLKMFQ